MSEENGVEIQRLAKQDFKAVRGAFVENFAHRNELGAACCIYYRGEKVVDLWVGLVWAGGLALGGGYGVVDGTPLKELVWRGRSMRAALVLTAASLAAGNLIPEEAVRLMAKQRITKWMILLLSPIGWLFKARKYHVETLLRRRPYFVD